MSQSLKNIQTAARSCARRERILNPNMADPSHLNYEGYHLGDPDSGYADEAELDESEQPEEEYDSGTLSRENLEVEGLMVHDHHQHHTERQFILKQGPHEHNENASPIAPRGSSASACDSKYTKHDASAEYLVDAPNGTRMKNVSIPASLQGDVASFQTTGDTQVETNVSDGLADKQCDSILDVNTTSNAIHGQMLSALKNTLHLMLLSTMMSLFFVKISSRRSNSIRRHSESSSQGPDSTDSSPEASMNSNSSSATPSSSTQNGVPKRDLDRDGGKEEDERPRKRPAKDSFDKLLETRVQQRLPCPFRIYDSTLFKKNTGIDTCGGTWPDIAKLK